MTDSEIIANFEQILENTNSGYALAAVLAGVSPGTLQVTLAKRELPTRPRPRLRLIRWVDVNRNATRRSELRALDA